MSEPYVVKPGEGRALDLYDVRLWIKTISNSTSAFSLIEGIWQPGGFDPLPHLHENEDESFYVLEGEFDFQIGENVIRGEAGSFVFVPKGISHKFSVAGDRQGRLMFLHAPPLEGFFVELAELATKGPPDPRKIAPLMARWGMEAQVP